MNNPKTQVGGRHYNDMKIQPIVFIMENGLSYAQGNVIKYVCRYLDKNGAQDLVKAKQYIDFMLTELKNSELSEILKNPPPPFKFPFEEGDTYYSVDEFGVIYESVWDDVSEEDYDTDKAYFATFQEAMNYIVDNHEIK